MNHSRSIPRYVVVGGASALLSNGILIGFDRAGIHYAISCAVAFVVTLLLAYTLHTHWTFGSERSVRGLLRYAAALALNLPVSVALLFGLKSIASLPMVFAAPCATALLTMFNYVVAARLLRPAPRVKI